MTFAEYKTSVKTFKKSILCFLINEDNVLLIMKKSGHGFGMWNGFGGKLEGEETFEECAIRGGKEEISVNLKSITHVATLFFFTPSKNNDNNWLTEVYIISKWDGLPDESEAVQPQWFNKYSLPFKEMWPDYIHWLPRVLDGEKIIAEFLLNEDMDILEFDIQPMKK